MDLARASRPAVVLHRSLILPIVAIVASMPFSSPPVRAAETPRSTWPGKYTVERDDATGVLELRTPYYAFRHDLRRGGAIAAIAYAHGKAANVLVRPVETRVRDGKGAVFSDLNDRAPRISHRMEAPGDASRATVTVEARLLDAEGADSGIRVKAAYEYRWGYVRIRKEILFPAEPSVPAEPSGEGHAGVREVCPFAAVLSPTFTAWGYREGTTEAEGAPPFGFGSCRWGTTAPPPASRTILDSPYVPRYAVFADPGVEGIEWFASSDLAQWELRLAGRRGAGRLLVERSEDPPGVSLSISPLHRAEGEASLEGAYAFDHYLGVPILEGRAHRPWLHTSFNRNRGDWVSKEAIERWAASGIQTVHCHNDGDYYDDGLFWRDGSYPPYPDMERYDAVIEGCRRAGIRVATYFSNKELHPSTEEFRERGGEWGRKDARGGLQHNFYKPGSEFGAQMCLRSGWLDFLKLSIDRVLRNHPLDGVYYDWNVALYCANGLHENGLHENGLHENGLHEKGLHAKGLHEKGAASDAPAEGHWDIDELLDLMEWTRRRVGPDGLVIVHNTTTPMFATENFADHVVATEWGYGKWSGDGPDLASLPLEWSFVGARSRGVISYGSIDPGAPRRLHRVFALQALLGGVTPWPASPETFDIVPILGPIGEVETCRFADWRNEAVFLEGGLREGGLLEGRPVEGGSVQGGRCASAIYGRPGEAYILLANLEKVPREVRCVVRPGRLPYPLGSIASARIVARSGGAGSGAADAGKTSDASGDLDAEALVREGVTVRVPADGAVMVRVR